MLDYVLALITTSKLLSIKQKPLLLDLLHKEKYSLIDTWKFFNCNFLYKD